MAWYVQFNSGTKDAPKLSYYKGFYRGGQPMGPIMVSSPTEAYPFYTKEQAQNVIGGSEALRGAVPVELADDAEVDDRRQRGALFKAPKPAVKDGGVACS